MTRVALYARYSSEHQKESSITDQFRNCEQRAAREGWTITARYEDQAFSGTTTERPGYQQMLKDAKARQFDALLVDDFSRLSRDTIEAEQTRRRMVFYGIRLIGCSDGIDTASKGHKIHMGFKAMQNEHFLDDLKEKIKRGMIGQAERTFWQGGRVYGYRLVPEYDPTKKNCYGEPAKIGTRLEIDAEQARWVRWIFEQYADGRSPLKIVTELNRRHVPSPGAAYKNRHYPNGPSWSALALHGEISRGTGLLNNQLYHGVYLWNRSRREKDPDTGRQVNIWRPREEWIEERVPQLRIVPDELWARAQERRRKVSESVAALRASLHCRARSTGRGPKYLFSGLLRCGVCRQPFVICESTKYGCSTFRTRGESDRTCSNGLKVERRLVESLLLAPIQRDLFTQEGFAVFKKEVARLLAERRRTQKPDREQAARQLKAVEREITAIMEAIKRGILTSTTKAALEKAEAERARLLPLVKARPVEPVATFLPNAIGRFRKLVEALGTVTPQQVDKARGILRELVGEIPLYPASDGAERYLTAELAGNYAGVIPLLGEAKLKLVAVTRIERVTRGL